MRSLPSLATNKSFPSGSSLLDSPSRHGDSFARLSGLADPHNSSGLFAERTHAARPTSLCVRCGSMHSSICIPCSEVVCENTLTFYRKTRAAGAAVLFNNAFVEAGNSKLVKFVVFRLLRNGFEARKKQQLKMKSVVEKFFGTNTVYVPFAAWRRYTRQNIMERKNRTIGTLEEKARKLEMQLRALTTENASLTAEVKTLNSTVREQSATIEESSVELKILRETQKKDRTRILGLCNLAKPLERFSSLMDETVTHGAVGLRHYLNYAVSHCESHNYANIFQDNVLADLREAQREFEMKTKHRKANAPLAISTQVIVDWVTSVSHSASKLVDPMEKQSLDRFLPPPDEIKSIKDFRTGRDIIRLLVALIWEYHRKEVNAMSYQAHNDSENRRRSAQAPNLLTLENLHEIHKVMDSPIPLVTLALHYANEVFGVPNFKPLDIVAGKGDVIFALLASIMNAVKPLVQSDEYNEIGKFMGQYNDLNQLLWDVSVDKKSLTHFDDLIRMWARYHDLDPATGEELAEVEVEVEVEAEAVPVDAVFEDAAGDGDGDGDGDGAVVVEAVAAVEDDDGTLHTGKSQQQQHQQQRRQQQLFPQKVDYEERYHNLCTAIDLFLSNREDSDLSSLCKRTNSISAQFQDLSGKVSRSREDRAAGIRMTTELRQFVTKTFMDRSLHAMELLKED